MDAYVPEEGSLSAALLAEVANGQARDLRAARARIAELEAAARTVVLALDDAGRLHATTGGPELAAVLATDPTPKDDR